MVLTHYPIWLSGAVLAEVVLLAGPNWTHRWLLLPGFALTFSGYLLVPSPALQILFACGYASVAVTLCSLLSEGATASTFGKLFQAFGVRSYTMYIVHFPFLTFLSARGIAIHGQRPLGGWFATAGGLAAILFCCLCFEVVERHFLHSRLRLSAPKSNENGG